MRVQYTSPSAFVCLTFSTIRNFKMSKAKTNKKHTTIALKFNSGLSLERKEKQQFEEARRENFWGAGKVLFLVWSNGHLCVYFVMFFLLSYMFIYHVLFGVLLQSKSLSEYAEI